MEQVIKDIPFLLSIPAIVGAAILDIVILDFLDFSEMYMTR
jgi:hypothetical protein